MKGTPRPTTKEERAAWKNWLPQNVERDTDNTSLDHRWTGTGEIRAAQAAEAQRKAEAERDAALAKLAEIREYALSISASLLKSSGDMHSQCPSMFVDIADMAAPQPVAGQGEAQP